MIVTRSIFRVIVAVLLVAGAWTMLAAAAFSDDKPKDEPAKKSGTVVGSVTARAESWMEVKADGEEKARRYVPRWVGGAPKNGGGYDKKTLAALRDVKVGSRVRLEWEFEERPRVVKLEVLKAPDTKDSDEKATEKKGTVAGSLTAKGDNWIEVKADGEEKGRRYYLHFGGTKEVRDAIKETAVGSRVRIEWLFHERPRVLKLEVLKPADKDR